MVYLYTPPKYKRPQVYIEEPRRLTVPVRITRIRHEPVTTVQIAKRREKSGPKSTICRWYNRKKALRELKNYKKKEKKIEYERLKQAREAEFIKLYQQQEIEKAKLDKERQKREYELEKARRDRDSEVYEIFRKQARAAARESKTVFKKTKPKKIKVEKVKEKKIKVKKFKEKKIKEKKIKEPKERKVKTVTAKPRAEPRYASVKVKKRVVVDSISARFVNCCYKLCCQLYCWMTIILIIGVVLILLL